MKLVYICQVGQFPQRQILTKQLNKMKKTSIFLILNEASLSFISLNGTPLKFETHEDAENHAAGILNLWQIVEVSFFDKHIYHLPNITSENLKEIN